MTLPHLGQVVVREARIFLRSIFPRGIRLFYRGERKAKAFFATILARAPGQARFLRPSLRLPYLRGAHRLHLNAHRHH
jgi:hypothetical protein